LQPDRCTVICPYSRDELEGELPPPASIISPFALKSSIRPEQKQGILPLWFHDKADYARISSQDTVETVGLDAVLRGDRTAQVSLKVTKPSGESFTIPTRHTLADDQVDWIKAGSALNHIAALKA
jgi:hypothetical protein